MPRTLPIFVNTICPVGVNCGECRNKEGGRRWRDDAAKFYQMPEGGTDFPCPYEKPWGFTPPPWVVPPPPEPTLEDRLAAEVDRAAQEGRPLGETSHDILKAMGAERVAAFWTWATGRDCGCQKRREWLNQHFPRGLLAWAREKLGLTSARSSPPSS